MYMVEEYVGKIVWEGRKTFDTIEEVKAFEDEFGVIVSFG